MRNGSSQLPSSPQGNNQVQKTKEKDQTYWKAFIILSSLIYLVPELTFNGILVAVAGAPTTDTDILHTVEIFGRAVSSIGVSLLVSDLLVKAKWVTSIPRVLMYFACVFSIFGPITFFGQKLLIDKLLVDPSTAEERYTAYYSSIVKSALANNLIEITDLPFNADKASAPTEKTFLSLFGGLLYLNPELLVKFNSKEESVVRSFVKKEALSNLDKDYNNYKAASEKVKAKYESYDKSSQKYFNERGNTSKLLASVNVDITTKVIDGWKKYQRDTKSLNNVVDKKTKQAVPLLDKYFKFIKECETKGRGYEKCVARADKSYYRKIPKLGFGSVKPVEWEKEKFFGGSEYFYNDINGMHDHYRDVIRQKTEAEYVTELGGYPLDIESYSDFYEHPETLSRVIEDLHSKEIIVPSDWEYDDTKDLKKALSSKVNQVTDKRWRAEVTRNGQAYIPPGLSWFKFQRTKPVQKRFKTKMGDSYVSPTLATWNNKIFFNKVINPTIKRKTKEILKVIRGSVKLFDDGGKYEENGKSALRSVLVPLVSITLSLVLCLTTIAKLLSIGVVKFIENVFVLYKIKKPFSLGIKVVTITLLLFLPYALGGNAYTAKNSVVGDLFNQIEQKTSMAISGPLRWMLVVQPSIQPLGQAINNVVGVIDKGYTASSLNIKSI